MSNIKEGKEVKAAKKTKGLLAGFLIGGAIGGAIALLYAPKAGRELRENISRKTRRLIDDEIKNTDQLWTDTKDKAGSMLESANSFLETGRDKIVSEAEKVKDAFKAGVNAYNEERKHEGKDEGRSSKSSLAGVETSKKNEKI